MKLIMHLYYDKYSWEDTGRFELWPARVDFSDKIYIKEVEVEIPDCEVPSTEQITEFQVTKLREQKTEILADTHRKVQELDEKIQQLLCLTAPEGEQEWN